MTATFLSLLGSKDGFGAVVAEVAEAVERKRGKRVARGEKGFLVVDQRERRSGATICLRCKARKNGKTDTEVLVMSSVFEMWFYVGFKSYLGFFFPGF